MSRTTRSKAMPFTTVPDGYLEPTIGTSGVAALPAKTVIEQFEETVSRFSDRPAMGLKRPVNGKVCALVTIPCRCHCPQ